MSACAGDALCNAFAAAWAMMTYPDTARSWFHRGGFPGHRLSRDACSEDRTAHLAIRRRQGMSRSV